MGEYLTCSEFGSHWRDDLVCLPDWLAVQHCAGREAVEWREAWGRLYR